MRFGVVHACSRSGSCCSMVMAMATAILSTMQRGRRRGLAARHIGTVDLVLSRLDNAVRIRRTAKQTVSVRVKRSSRALRRRRRRRNADITYLDPSHLASNTPLLRLRMPPFLPQGLRRRAIIACSAHRTISQPALSPFSLSDRLVPVLRAK